MNPNIKCPRGHKLPNRTPYGQCLPTKCAKPESKNKGKNQHTRHAAQEAQAFGGGTTQPDLPDPPNPDPPATSEIVGEGSPRLKSELATIKHDELPVSEMKPVAIEAMKDQAKFMAKGVGQHVARKAFLHVPENLTGQAADEWVQAQQMEMAVDAIAELRYQQKLGNDETRREIAYRVLDSTGHGKKEGGGTVVAPIIILQGPEVGSPPWIPKLVDGKKEPAK